MKPQERVVKPKMTHEQVIEVGKAVTADIDQYQRTGHCGQCCRPGRTCSCPNSARCGCWDLHDGNRDLHPEMESLALFEDAGPRRGKRYEMGA